MTLEEALERLRRAEEAARKRRADQAKDDYRGEFR